MASKPEIRGTAFKVDGTWYIRHLGGGGNLIKLEAQSPFKEQLEEGRMYEIEGYISRNHNGCDVACYAKSGSALGSPKAG